MDRNGDWPVIIDCFLNIDDYAFCVKMKHVCVRERASFNLLFFKNKQT